MILSWLKAYALQAAIIALGAVTLFAGLQTWRLDSAQKELAAAESAHLKALNEINAKSKAEELARAKEAAIRQNTHLEIDKKFYEALNHAKAERDNLDAAIRSGKYRVYVRAHCPSTGGVPATSNGSSVDSGAGAELSAEAGQLVSGIREGAKRFDAKLAACQAALKVELSR